MDLLVESLYMEMRKTELLIVSDSWYGKIKEVSITYLKMISLLDNTFLSWKSKEILKINFCGYYKFSPCYPSQSAAS